EAGKRTYRRAPRGPRVGGVDQVQVDREPAERLETRFAVRFERLGPAIWHPCAAGSSHTALGDDPRAPMPTAGAQRTGHQALVVPEASSLWPVGVGCIEYAYAGAGSGGGRVQRGLLIRRPAPAAEA